MFKKIKLKFIVSFLVLAYLVLVPFVIFSNINTNASKANNFEGVIELWNIDTFEGGSTSRSGWLKRRAIAFEKSNEGVYILVKNLTYEQMKAQLSAGYLPDMVSYGIGAGSVLLPYLQRYNGMNLTRADIAAGGFFGSTFYAVPWTFGGYALIGNNEITSKFENVTSLINNVFSCTYKTKKKTISSLTTSALGFNIPLISLLKNTDLTAQADSLNVEISQNTQYSAYEQFVGGGSAILLGTQRDVYRCSNRQNNGVGDYTFEFLGGYTDLVQYISVVSENKNIAKAATNFIEYITSENSQRKLTEINMFSTVLNDLYTDEIYKQFESTLSKKLKVLNVFTDDDNISAILSDSLKAVLGDGDAIKSAKKIYD